MRHSSPLPAASAVVTLEVADFDAWKKTFDARSHLRQDAAILGHHILRDADEPAVISVLLPASDRGKLERFLISEYLAARPRGEGAAGAPSVTLLVPQEDRAARHRTLALAVVSLEVESYDRWKATFDADSEARRRAGIVGYVVNRSATRPSEVVLHVQAETVEPLRAYIASSELASRLRKGGVCSPPHVRFLKNTGETAKYREPDRSIS